MTDAQTLLEQVPAWVEAAGAGVVAVGLAGSWARGTARPDSDVDLVVLVADRSTQAALLADEAAVAWFGPVVRSMTEDWGLIQSRRVFYASGLEVEFGIGALQWAATTPVDPGTRRVVGDGFRVLYDPDGVLTDLVAAVRESSTPAE